MDWSMASLAELDMQATLREKDESGVSGAVSS